MSDLESWLKWTVAKTYADDTTTRTLAKTLEELIMKMEEDASNVLSFMASNGLVANASKTSFVVLNLCKSDRDEAKINPLKVKIGPTTVT